MAATITTQALLRRIKQVINLYLHVRYKTSAKQLFDEDSEGLAVQ